MFYDLLEPICLEHWPGGRPTSGTSGLSRHALDGLREVFYGLGMDVPEHTAAVLSTESLILLWTEFGRREPPTRIEGLAIIVSALIADTIQLAWWGAARRDDLQASAGAAASGSQPRAHEAVRSQVSPPHISTISHTPP